VQEKNQPRKRNRQNGPQFLHEKRSQTAVARNNAAKHQALSLFFLRKRILGAGRLTAILSSVIPATSRAFFKRSLSSNNRLPHIIPWYSSKYALGEALLQLRDRLRISWFESMAWEIFTNSLQAWDLVFLLSSCNRSMAVYVSSSRVSIMGIFYKRLSLFVGVCRKYGLPFFIGGLKNLKAKKIY
jgi:hypothetical protein